MSSASGFDGDTYGHHLEDPMCVGFKSHFQASAPACPLQPHNSRLVTLRQPDTGGMSDFDILDASEGYL